MKSILETLPPELIISVTFYLNLREILDFRLVSKLVEKMNLAESLENQGIPVIADQNNLGPYLLFQNRLRNLIFKMKYAPQFNFFPDEEVKLVPIPKLELIPTSLYHELMESKKNKRQKEPGNIKCLIM